MLSNTLYKSKLNPLAAAEEEIRGRKNNNKKAKERQEEETANVCRWDSKRMQMGEEILSKHSLGPFHPFPDTPPGPRQVCLRANGKSETCCDQQKYKPCT
eukprot:749768-Hanusia_phi.AAC.4